MLKRARLPIALTIAGSDSGGGAGVQADLKTFAALGVHGTSAITCVTAQNPRRILAVEACSPLIVRRQIEAVFQQLRPSAVKTGMLFSAGTIAVVADFFRRGTRPPLIVDPVMVATSGADLLPRRALACLEDQLLPLATLITPNLDEGEALCGFPIREPEDMRAGARLLRKRYGCAVLIKGGHLTDAKNAVDIFYDGKTELLLSAPFVRGVGTHGTGCTYAAAIAAYCARGFSLIEAVQRAKEFVTQAIAGSYRAGGHEVLNPSSTR